MIKAGMCAVLLLLCLLLLNPPQSQAGRIEFVNNTKSTCYQFRLKVYWWSLDWLRWDAVPRRFVNVKPNSTRIWDDVFGSVYSIWRIDYCPSYGVMSSCCWVWDMESAGITKHSASRTFRVVIDEMGGSKVTILRN